MSVNSEITRIENAKESIKTAIEGKGVTVPSGTKLDGMAALINSIQSGGGGVEAFTISSISVRNSSTYYGKIFVNEIECDFTSYEYDTFDFELDSPISINEFFDNFSVSLDNTTNDPIMFGFNLLPDEITGQYGVGIVLLNM